LTLILRSKLIALSASSSLSGFASFRMLEHLVVSRDESFGLLAFHYSSIILAGAIRFGFRLNVSASFFANSYLLALLAPEVCRTPVAFSLRFR